MLTSKRQKSNARLRIVNIYRFSEILCRFRYCRGSYDDALYTASLFTPGLRSYHLFRFCFSGNCWQSGNSVFAQSIYQIQ
uniref:Uncharacterized protein n=1 Tax=Myoviridae sp. ct4yW2 TaxID=2827286 RepID=A0A8S5R9L2_9CAUD|nr:MAG TPA: hypothetical protein [Myoviridae sp. ct4yW2]